MGVARSPNKAHAARKASVSVLADLDESDPASLIKSELEAHHQTLSELCGRLENIADCLPDNVDGQECLIVARNIFSIVKHAHEFEEDRVFPFLGHGGLADASLERSLERLRFEHWEDESYAEEISENLLQFVVDPSNRNTEMLSYMLRGFFEGMRRHIAFETEHLVPRL